MPSGETIKAISWENPTFLFLWGKSRWACGVVFEFFFPLRSWQRLRVWEIAGGSVNGMLPDAWRRTGTWACWCVFGIQTCVGRCASVLLKRSCSQNTFKLFLKDFTKCFYKQIHRIDMWTLETKLFYFFTSIKSKVLGSWPDDICTSIWHENIFELELLMQITATKKKIELNQDVSDIYSSKVLKQLQYRD